LEIPKGVIRTRASKDRQHNSQKEKDKRPNNDLQNTMLKTKNRATRCLTPSVLIFQASLSTLKSNMEIYTETKF